MALVKQVKGLMDMLGPHKADAVQVLVDQLEATKGVYYEGERVDTVPDEIVRQKAAVAILEWLEGKPRELQMVVSGNFTDFNTVIEKVKSSPAMMAALGPLKSLQNTAQGEESAGKDAPAAGEETENPPGQKFTVV
jgi:hypothetical protein